MIINIVDTIFFIL